MATGSPGDLKWYEHISQNIINNIEHFFHRLGYVIAERPIRTIGICFVLVLLSALGFFRFHQEKNPIKLWVPENSNFFHDTDWLISTFKQAQRPQVILLKSKDVLIPQVLRELNTLNDKILNAQTSENVTWSDVCFKIPMIDSGLVGFLKQSVNEHFDPGSGFNLYLYCSMVQALPLGCYQQSLLELWNYDSNKLKNITKEEILTKINETRISPATGHPVDYERLLGGVVRNETGHIVSAKTLLSFWIIDVDFTVVDMNKAGNDIGTADWATENILTWETKFSDILANATAEIVNMEVFYASGRSFSDISGETMMQDMPVLMAGIVLMIIYIQLAISRFNFIDIKVIIGFCGLTSIGMAFISACGICSLFGIFYGPVHTSLPFLLMGLGSYSLQKSLRTDKHCGKHKQKFVLLLFYHNINYLGVDDMFVITACWNSLSPSQKKSSLPERIGYMLQHAGVSITVTSITDFMAFFVGSFTILPSLKSFCIYAAAGVLTTFLFVVTFFVACFALDQMRAEQYRNGIIPCIKHEPYEPNKCSQTQYSKKIFSFCYDSIILTKPGKIAVFIITIILTGVGIEGTLNLKQKFDPMWFIPQNTYLTKYVEQRRLFYPNMGFEAGLYTGQINYTHEYNNIKELSMKLENLTTMLYVTSSWVHPFHQYVEKNFGIDLDEEVLTNQKWDLYLSKFLFSPSGAKFQANFKFDEKLECGEPAKKIMAASIDFRFHAFTGPEQYIPAMRTAYSISNNANITTGDRFVTVWGKIFANWITDEVIEQELTRNLGLALVCVMFCTMVLIANIQICFWIFICVLLTMVNVCGWMQKWGLTIDLVSCIALTLAIGLCVDYAAHIGYTFLTSSGASKRGRVLQTVTTIGSAVLHGGLSTLLALSMLSQSQAYTFQAFFKIFLLVVLFGQFYGIVLLPVILSLVGPKSRKTHEVVTQNEL